MISRSVHHDGMSPELSYMFLPEWWQQGFASESLAAVPKHTFTDLQLPFVVAETQTKSTRSVRLLEKLGRVRSLRYRLVKVEA